MKEKFLLIVMAVLVCCMSSITPAQATCYNCTDGGAIGSDQSGCSPFDPALLTNVQTPQGGSGTLYYQWYYKNTSTNNNWDPISGATSSTYNPGAITETTCYKRYARRANCTNWAVSNSVCATINFCCNATINGLIVNNLSNNSNFLTLTNGGSYNLNTFPANWNIEALVSGTTHESVKFTITGGASVTNIENTTPYRTPGDAVVLNLAAGTYTINAKVYSADNAGGTKCDEKNITITLTQPPPCLINVNAGADVSLCTPTKVLTATTTGASTCTTQVITDCNHPLANSGGWLLDVPYSQVCGDNAGTKLWTMSGQGTSYITLDLGASLAAGTQVCVSMKLEHCANTNSTGSNAKIQASTAAASGFVNLASSVIFSHTNFQEYCYTLASAARYIRITDNGQCAFRVDYVKSIIPGTSNSTVNYSWSGPGIVGATNTASVTVNQPGSYIVTATDCKGCVDADTVVVIACCNLDVNAGADVSSCTATNKVLNAVVTGAATCTTQVISDCNHPLANSGGWLLDVPYSQVCGDNLGTKLWTMSGQGTSYITLDMGVSLPAGTPICVSLKLEHCANTNSTGSNAKIQASTAAASGFVNLTSSVIFSHTNFQEYCYNLPSAARYIRITDNGQCAFRVDYVKYTIPGTSNSAVTYSWSGPGIVGPNNTASVTVNQPGSYIVVATDCKGCSDADTVKYILNQPPTCSVTGNLEICQGGSTELCAPAGLSSYLWSTGATTRCINVNAAGTYSVTVTNSYGCSSTCNATVIVRTPPVCSVSGNLEICQGGSTELCALAGYSSYVWSTGATTRCINVNVAGTYTVTVTNSYGCSSTCNATVIVRTPPVCSISCNNLEICQGSSTELCAAAGFASYSWSNGATTRCITVNTGGTYYVTVTNQYGCSSTCNATVIVHELPVCEINCGDLHICTGETTELCAAAGFASYSWSNGATTRCITVSAGGTYSVTVTNQYGCSSTCNTTVYEHQLPVCEINCGDLHICTGETTELCAAAGFASYSWSNGATTRCITVSAGGTYSVTVTNQYGCSSTCNTTVYEHQLPVCEINCGDLHICTGETTELCAAAGFASYSWSNGATTRCITVSAGGTYSVTVTNQYGCSSTCNTTVYEHQLPVCEINCGDLNICTGETTELCAAAGFASYSWSNGATTRCITVSAGGTYYVTVTNQYGCSSTCNTTVIEHQLPVCEINCGDLNICTGETTELCAAAGFASYSWSNGATTRCITVSAGGTYYVTVTNAHGCSSTCSATVVEHQLPVCEINCADLHICTGESTELCAAAGFASYSWSNGATTRCINVTAGGTYYVTVTNQYGCSSTCNTTVIEHQLPVCEINCADLNICTGETTELCAAAGFASYSWSNGATTRCITVSAGGTYYVTVSNGHGCSSTCSATVNEYQKPVCSINGGYACCSGDPMQLCVPNTVTGVTYLWSTGATTRCIEVYTTGNYTVTVTNANGCSSTCDKYVLFYPRPEITMPVFGQVCDTLTNGIVLSGATPVGGVYSGVGVVNGKFYPAVAGVGTHYIYYTSDNGHCSSIDSALIEVVQCVCLVPSTPQITGLTGVCRSSVGSYVAVGATGATSYVWTVGGGATIIYGQGTDSIVVQFGCQTCTGGNICVTASNRCGAAPQVCMPFNIVLTAPVLSGTISGPVNEVCPGSTFQYCIPASPTAVNYVWTIPANTSIIAGNGTNCITLQILAGFTSGNLAVQGQNCKGLSGSKTISLKSLPGQPATITGPATPLCNATNVAFSIAPVTGATGYNWIVPAGATITSGLNTASITVDFGPAFVSGNVSVNATNACGAGPQRHLAVKAKPTAVAAINGPLSVCANDAGVAYSVVAEAGVTYTWVVPTGASVVSGQGTASVLVNFGTASGNVRVTPSNACGAAGAKTVAVNVASCARVFNMESEVSKSISNINVFPNPAKSDLTVQFTAETESSYAITVTDLIGKVVYSSVINSVEGDNQAKLNVSDFPEGLYMLTLKGADFNRVVRITVQ